MAKKKRPLVDRLKADIETQKGFLERLAAGHVTLHVEDNANAWRDTAPVAVGRTRHLLESLEDALKMAEENEENSGSSSNGADADA
ncbi:MAG: hypothetical protein ACRBCJ_12325 [Hyphomicrobiaceae bacterium]